MKLKQRYLLVVGLALALLLANQMYVQYSLQVSTDDAYTMNVTGRQRMLTQRITYYLIADKPDFESSQQWLDRFENTHHILLNAEHSDQLNLSELALVELRKAAPALDTLRSFIRRAEELSPVEKRFAASTLNDLRLLNDGVVHLVELGHNERIRTIRILELVIALLIISVVMYEIFAIFLPAFKRISLARDEVVKRSAALSDQLRLIRVIARDIKEPIRSIISSIQEIESRSQQPKVSEEFGILRTSAIDMKTTVNTLLSPREVGARLPKELLKVNDVLMEVKRDISHLMVDSNALVLSGCHALIYGNRIEMRLLFQNLITNAIKYRKPDVAPVVEVLCSSSRGILKIEIKDNGLGISPEDQSRVFDFKYRADQKSSTVGYGYGLSHCREIVLSHNGRIELESALGKGSSFKIFLPQSPIV